MNNDQIAPQRRDSTGGLSSHAPIPTPPTPAPAPMPPSPGLPSEPQPPVEEPPTEQQPSPIGDPQAPPPPAVGAANPWESVAGEEDPGSALDLVDTAAPAETKKAR